MFEVSLIFEIEIFYLGRCSILEFGTVKRIYKELLQVVLEDQQGYLEIHFSTESGNGLRNDE